MQNDIDEAARLAAASGRPPDSMTVQEAAAARAAVRDYPGRWEAYREEDYAGEAVIILLAADDATPAFLLSRCGGLVHLTTCSEDHAVFEGAFPSAGQALRAAAARAQHWPSRAVPAGEPPA